MQNKYQDWWFDQLRRTRVIWEHDGDLRRPFAQLTTDNQISDGYADLAFAMANPYIFQMAAYALAELLPEQRRNILVCGQEKGSVTLASHLAATLRCGHLFTEKVTGEEKAMRVADRFDGIHPLDYTVFLVEDVTTSGNTSHLSREALHEVGFGHISDILLTVVDRTGGDNDFGFEVVSCCAIEAFSTWEKGNNPFTSDGKEVVPPVRPKTAVGRKALRQVFAD